MDEAKIQSLFGGKLQASIPRVGKLTAWIGAQVQGVHTIPQWDVVVSARVAHASSLF
jgi:hypothetical protein